MRISLECDVRVPKDDPVRLLSAVLARIDYRRINAAFMHMKEDHMRNGQLKPGYNDNVATANGIIVGHYISVDRSGVKTLTPFMKKLREAYPKHHPGRVVVDSGYESEDNDRSVCVCPFRCLFRSFVCINRKIEKAASD